MTFIVYLTRSPKIRSFWVGYVVLQCLLVPTVFPPFTNSILMAKVVPSTIVLSGDKKKRRIRKEGFHLFREKNHSQRLQADFLFTIQDEVIMLKLRSIKGKGNSILVNITDQL